MRANDIKFFDGREAVTAKDNSFTKPLDGSNLYNVKSPFYVIDFTNANVSGIVSWNQDHSQVTFTHTLNCYPIVTVYNNLNEQVIPVVTVLSGNSFTLDFNQPDAVSSNETWHCIINYGCEYENGNGSFSEQMTATMNSIADYLTLATEVNRAINSINLEEEF